MGMKFTEDQQRVIDLRNCNILVSAAAGSGKTAVLVERIVELVSGSGCDSARAVDIDRLLIVTFTNAAAAQMRERITKALSDRVEAEPDNEHIKKQVEEFLSGLTEEDRTILDRYYIQEQSLKEIFPTTIFIFYKKTTNFMKALAKF